MGDKLACIALTCYITNELRKKGQKVTCYDVLLKVGNDFGEVEKNTFLKSLGAICEDLMYGCNTFLDFGIKPKDMPKQLKILLDNYVPFNVKNFMIYLLRNNNFLKIGFAKDV